MALPINPNNARGENRKNPNLNEGLHVIKPAHHRFQRRNTRIADIDVEKVAEKISRKSRDQISAHFDFDNAAYR